MAYEDKTALVTGANAGLGFEAAAQLADDGWGTVILACRSKEKAERAASELRQRTGKDVFATLTVDTSEVASAQAACDELLASGKEVDFLLLNAGASGKDPSFNSAGIEVTYASTLVGHHVMTMRLLSDGLLASHARIVIAGSEGARGNMPGMEVLDVARIADRDFAGDWVDALEAIFRVRTPRQANFNNMREYVTAKVVVAWWAAAVARELPAGMTVNAVSPGAALSTSFARNANAVMSVMLPLMKVIGPLMGMQGPIEDAARRYLDAAGFTDDDTGHFYATAHRKKCVGPMAVQTWPEYFLDPRGQRASLEALARVTGVGLPS